MCGIPVERNTREPTDKARALRPRRRTPATASKRTRTLRTSYSHRYIYYTDFQLAYRASLDGRHESRCAVATHLAGYAPTGLSHYAALLYRSHTSSRDYTTVVSRAGPRLTPAAGPAHPKCARANAGFVQAGHVFSSLEPTSKPRPTATREATPARRHAHRRCRTTCSTSSSLGSQSPVFSSTRCRSLWCRAARRGRLYTQCKGDPMWLRQHNTNFLKACYLKSPGVPAEAQNR